MTAMSRADSNLDPELLALSEEQARLEASIAASMAEPERIRRQLEEERATLPPTDDFRERERQREFEERATRGKIRNEHKSQRRSLLLMVLFALASACLIAWGLKLMGL